MVENEIKVESAPVQYALIILYDYGRCEVDYCKEYPDLKLSKLIYSTQTEKADNKIAGYALYESSSPFWEPKLFCAPEQLHAQRLREFAQRTLNNR